MENNDYDRFLDILIKTANLKNSLYGVLKYNFLYNSNKIEGSTFTLETLALLLDKNVVEGRHTLDDIQETVNSSYVFDEVIETLGERINDRYLKNLHARLMFNTTIHSMGYAGAYKTIPNMISGAKVQLAQPFEVQAKLDELFEWYYSLKKVTLREIAEFHIRFERIHPFQDGNGRIGRFIMLKQMLENKLPIKIISWDAEGLYKKSLANCEEKNYMSLEKYINSLIDFVEEHRILY